MRRFVSLLLLAASALPAQVTYERIVNALKEPQNWLTYWGDYTAVRHRDLKQINLANAKDLRVEWMFQSIAILSLLPVAIVWPSGEKLTVVSWLA